MLCWHVRMLLPHSQHHICALEHFVTKKQTITALSQLIITAGWAGGRKAEQRDHWNGEQGEKQLGGAMSCGAWLVILHPLGKVCCNQHIEQSSGGRGKPPCQPW